MKKSNVFQKQRCEKKGDIGNAHGFLFSCLVLFNKTTRVCSFLLSPGLSGNYDNPIMLSF